MFARRVRRRGTQLIETAIVLPVLVTMLLGLVIGAAGVFSNSQIAMLAGEGARWASVHGPTYASETSNAAATSQTLMSNCVLPLAAGVSTSDLSGTLLWSTDGSTWTTTPTGAKLVKVTLTYHWMPLLYYGPVTLSSTAVMAVTY